jgi:hypothetical protein
MRTTYTPIRLAKIQNTDDTKCWHRWVATGTPFISSENAKWYSHFGRQFWQFLTKLSYSYHMIQQLHSLVSTQSVENYAYTKICTWRFIEAQFKTAEKWK